MSLAKAQTKEPTIFSIEENGYLNLYGQNQALYPISLTFDFDIKGLKKVGKWSDLVVLPALADTFLIGSFSIPQGRSWSYKYAYDYSVGDANAQHNDDLIYTLPYLPDQPFLVSQGYFGNASHQKENALDFTMPEGTLICAARAGLIVDLKQDSDRGCPDISCNEDGNYIKILHEDGTMADYYHLQWKGVMVELGQKIEAGEVIGKAGDTGWASGSHLHFIVYKPSSNGRISYQTKFKSIENKLGEYLVEGKWYSALH